MDNAIMGLIYLVLLGWYLWFVASDALNEYTKESKVWWAISYIAIGLVFVNIVLAAIWVVAGFIVAVGG